MFYVAWLSSGNRDVRHPVILFLIALAFVLASRPVAYEVKAADDILSWKRVPVPLEGDAGGWVLADDADIMCLEMGSDGSLYCHATPSGTTHTLFKSVDDGRSWESTGGVTADI